MGKKVKANPSQIAQNKKAKHDYFIEERIEAGLQLSGWEVKSLRAGKANLTDSYVLIKSGEAFLLGCHITPLKSASTHVLADPTRTRKLLLHAKELDKLIALKDQKGYTLLALALYWKNHLVKVEVAVAKGKKLHDKRADAKDKDWAREKERVMKKTVRS